MNSKKNWVKIVFYIFFVVIVVIISVLYVNRAKMYAVIGEFYSKHEDYLKAQNYFEKSYALGNTGNSFREKYVNLIINSPLTIKSQERLVEIAEDKKNDVASETAKYFLYNLKREINNRYPDNYVQQAVYNQQIVHWGKIPITYSFKQTKNVPKEIVNAVNDAFDAWERASSARIRFEKIPVNADIVVSFAQNTIPNPKFGRKYVIAYTVPEIYQSKLEKMHVTINTVNVDGEAFSEAQIYNTALHEIFHALGFVGHCEDENNIMYMSHDNKIAEKDVKRKELSEPDKITLELLYKIKPDITNANELSYDYIPYPVLGNKTQINFAKADEASKYIKKAPNIPSGYVDLAQVLINEKKYEEAVATLERAYQLTNNSDSKYLVLYNLAVANYYNENYDQALFYIKKAKDYSEDESLHSLRAEILKKQKNNDMAIEEYKYLVEKYPAKIDYAINLANIYINKYNYFKARRVLKNFIKQNPNEKNNPIFSKYKLLLL